MCERGTREGKSVDRQTVAAKNERGQNPKESVRGALFLVSDVCSSTAVFIGTQLFIY